MTARQPARSPLVTLFSTEEDEEVEEGAAPELVAVGWAAAKPESEKF